MKYCMMTYTVARQRPDSVDMVEICRLARDLGLDAVDQVTLYGYEPGEIRRIVEDFGLRIVCYTFDANVNHSDPALRQAGVDGFRRELDHALELGVSLIMLPLRGRPEFTRDQSRGHLTAVLPEMVRLAREVGITLTVEHFPGALSPFLVSADMNETIVRVPDLRVTFDSGNVVTGGEDPGDGFLNSRDWIVHAHFKDFIRRPAGSKGIAGLDGAVYTPALIGEGVVDYRRLLGVMKDAGYSGYINIEYEGNDYPAGEAIRRALDYLRQIEETCTDNVSISSRQ